VGFYSEIFEVLSEDLHIMRSAQSAAVYNVTWGCVENRETEWNQWL